MRLPRGFNLERSRVPLDPGHWDHLVVTWNAKSRRSFLYINAKWYESVSRELPEDAANIVPLYAEFGMSDPVTGSDGKAPRVEIDEVVGYNRPLAEDEIQQAHARWMGTLQPIRLYDDQLEFKYSLQKLEFSLRPLLPEGVTAQSCTVSLCHSNGGVVFGPFETQLADGRFSVVMSEGKELPYGAYQARFQVKDPGGKVVIDGKRDWNYREEEWRHCRAGILDKTPPPWTPIRVEGRTVATRMTTYTLGDDGLPAQIRADGADILACRSA